MQINYITILAIFFALLLPQSIFAEDTDIDSRTRFLDAISINKISDASFGTISFTNNNFGVFALNEETSAIICSNTTDYTCPPTGIRGEFTVSGTAGETIDIFCDNTGLMTNNSSSIAITASSFRVGSISANCDGPTNSAHEHILTNDVEDSRFFTGHALFVFAGNLNDQGIYSTANEGGDPINFNIVYR